MKRAILLFILSGSSYGFSCAVASSTTPLLSSASASWTSCNGTVPQSGDSVTVGFPLKIDSNLPASGSLTAFSINGSTATITWDGNPHKVTVAGQILLTLGCLAVGTGCATPFIIDTCTQAPTTANATGSAGVYNNDAFGQSGCAYSGPSPCAGGAVGHGFDNGVTAHPNALYGDVSFNPNFTGTVQFSAIDTPWIACDTKLGGTGSVANMFQTVMGGRAVSGYAQTYTPAQVVSCLRAPFAPTNPLAATSGSTGSYIGAATPASSSLPTVYGTNFGYQSHFGFGY